IHIPHGYWDLSSTVVIPNNAAHGTFIRGAGQGQTLIGAGLPTAEKNTILKRSSSWSSDSDALIEVRGGGINIEDLALIGSTDTAESGQAGYGVQLARGPLGAGSAPSLLTVRRCSGRGLVAVGAAGWSQSE